MIEVVEREGVGSTGSRLLRGERDILSEVEKGFALWKGKESSLCFATGYQANIGLMQTFLERDDVVFSDELNHASLIDGIRLSKCEKIIFQHLDVEQLENLLAETECKGQKFLVTESLFSMDGDISPLKKYAKICRRTKTNLIVDEAHSVGLYGERGSGLIEEFGIESEVFLSINTAGKSLGVSGAFVAGSNLANCSDKEIYDKGFRLEKPLSPHISARLANVKITIEDILSFVEEETNNKFWIVEGAGGILVPLNEKDLMLDLMKVLSLPVIIVSRSGLGTINQTLLTIETLRNHNLKILGVILNGEPNIENKKAIEDYGTNRVLAEMPKFEKLDLEPLANWSKENLDLEI